MFQKIRPEHVQPALDTLLASNRKQIEGLIGSEFEPSWKGFMEPLSELSEKLHWMWTPVSHLNAVRNSEDLRKVYETCLRKLTDYETELGQSRPLYDALVSLQSSAEYPEYDDARKKAVELGITGFKLAGVHLNGADKERFRANSARQSELGNRFSQNVLDATNAWSLHITDAEELAGLPEQLLETAKKQAEDDNKHGWVFTLHDSAYQQVMTHANSRALRETIFRAHVTRASELGPHDTKHDNARIICDILKLREEAAHLLGFESYAHYSLETKMADSPEEVAAFLDDLAQRSKPVAEQELKELREFARVSLDMEQLAAWDVAWASEKLKEERYSFTAEEVRPYFPIETVLNGLFALARELFGITVAQDRTEQVWDDSVQFFTVSDRNGQVQGYCYMDLYARPHKSGGGWMSDFRGRIRTESIDQLPVACLVCNFAASAGGRPALLDHEDVVTLFHEFGHSLHHLLTRVEIPDVAGIRGVPWDAVEFPSQFLENWCWDRQALDLMSGHYLTGEPIPDDLLDKIKSTRKFQSGMSMLRQIEFSLFDMDIHRMAGAGGSIGKVREVLDKVRQQVAVVFPPSFNRFENAFSHIFAGGYAAGYYSYKWAEVLAADAFELFEQRGILDAGTGHSFLHCVLEKGGSKDPMALFVDFRGRKPEIDALLRYSGLSGIPEQY